MNVTDPGLRREIGESIRKYYFNDKPGDSEECLTRVRRQYVNLAMISNNSKNALSSQALTDVGFYAGSTVTAKILGDRLKSPVYEYYFNYDSYLGVYKAELNIYRGIKYKCFK